MIWDEGAGAGVVAVAVWRIYGMAGGIRHMYAWEGRKGTVCVKQTARFFFLLKVCRKLERYLLWFFGSLKGSLRQERDPLMIKVLWSWSVSRCNKDCIIRLEFFGTARKIIAGRIVSSKALIVRKEFLRITNRNAMARVICGWSGMETKRKWSGFVWTKA